MASWIFCFPNFCISEDAEIKVETKPTTPSDDVTAPTPQSSDDMTHNTHSTSEESLAKFPDAIEGFPQTIQLLLCGRTHEQRGNLEDRVVRILHIANTTGN